MAGRIANTCQLFDCSRPRSLNSRVEAGLKRTTRNVWGVERKLRYIIKSNPGEAFRWSEILADWVNNHSHPGLVWDCVELVILDWILDKKLPKPIKDNILPIFSKIPQERKRSFLNRKYL